ncbi:winged helix-turn-helix transcriptional regulator [Microbacterium sp. 179-I 3D4 NHS]|uniref:winged helix-turn-helix transcriptional regulator n=1 Tax=Microbacterium sp. 179-I 3D4 NHS TaxID=3142381 RepID=UPI0039A369AD
MSDLATALEVVGGRWALLIVEQLLEGPQRYGDLQRELGAPTNMLATRLRELEAAGVLTRLPLKHNTRAYALTERGFALRDAIEALSRWAAPGPRASVHDDTATHGS